MCSDLLARELSETYSLSGIILGFSAKNLSIKFIFQAYYLSFLRKFSKIS